MNVLQSTMLRHFPELNVAHPHRTRDYVIAAYTFLAVAVCLTLEVNASLGRQYVLGGIAFVSLLVMLLGEKKTRESKCSLLSPLPHGANILRRSIWVDTPIGLRMCRPMYRLVMEWYISRPLRWHAPGSFSDMPEGLPHW